MAEGMGTLEQMRDPPGFWRRDPKDPAPPCLPATIERRAHPLLAVLLPVTLVAPLGIIASFALLPQGPGEPTLVGMLMAEKPELVAALTAVLVLESILMLWLLRPALRRRTYTVDRMLVSCESRSPFGNEAWQESLGAYNGVRRLSVRQKGRTLYVVQLAHPQASHAVPLYVTTDAAAAQRQVAEWAAALHLPATGQQESQP